jgi:hypothetical protein
MRPRRPDADAVVSRARAVLAFRRPHFRGRPRTDQEIVMLGFTKFTRFKEGP